MERKIETQRETERKKDQITRERERDRQRDRQRERTEDEMNQRELRLKRISELSNIYARKCDRFFHTDNN